MSEPSTGTPIRNQYQTTSSFEWEERRLVLRGGALDGQEWTGIIGVGKRVFCGTGEWSTEGVYLVTADLQEAADGHQANVAVPAFA